MISVSFIELKKIMAKLFTESTFDDFLLCEASFVTFCTYNIDGGYHGEFYGDETIQKKYAYWGEVRPVCFNIIKGKYTPVRFKIILSSGKELSEKIALSADADIDKVNGLFMNFQYESGNFSCITGTSLSEFTLDKSIDNAWDDWLIDFLNRLEIVYDKH